MMGMHRPARAVLTGGPASGVAGGPVSAPHSPLQLHASTMSSDATVTSYPREGPSSAELAELHGAQRFPALADTR
jgi:hypothetical protein